MLGRVLDVFDAVLDFLLLGELVRKETVDKFRGSQIRRPDRDNPFSFKKERHKVYLVRTELDQHEEEAMDGFLRWLDSEPWWKRFEFFEKFGDYDATIPPAPKQVPKGQTVPKQYSPLARALKMLIKKAEIPSPGFNQPKYDPDKMRQVLEMELGYFQEKVSNPYYDLYQAVEKAKDTAGNIVGKFLGMLTGGGSGAAGGTAAITNWKTKIIGVIDRH